MPNGPLSNHGTPNHRTPDHPTPNHPTPEPRADAPAGDAPPGAALTLAVLEIALDDRPKPAERAAAFAGRPAARAVEAFLSRFGRPGAEARTRAAEWREAARAAGRSLLLLSGPGYPPLLAEIAVPPIVLDVLGPIAPPSAPSAGPPPDPPADPPPGPPRRAAEELARPAVAVVGARLATPYGIGAAESLAEGLAEAGVTVVSGLARGVDAAAHRAALRVGGRTLAVLGAGHDHLYPPEHRNLAREVAASGAVLTEFPPDARPLPHHFPRRNRIIAGLAAATVVVEARERSGSLSTARHAADSNREVFAVPGPITSSLSAGCHSLLRSGAALVTGVADLLEELGPEFGPEFRPAPALSAPGRTPTGAAATGARPRPAPPDPGTAAAEVLETLRRHPSGASFDDLLDHCPLSPPLALAAVSELERRGLVERFPGDFLRARA